MKEIILDLMGWRKNVFIPDGFVRDDICINIYPPLSALFRDEIPLMQEGVKARFIKDGYNMQGMAIFKWS